MKHLVLEGTVDKTSLHLWVPHVAVGLCTVSLTNLQFALEQGKIDNFSTISKGSNSNIDTYISLTELYERQYLNK